MVKVFIDDESVGVSYDGGMIEMQPLTDSWLWLLGALEKGEQIQVQDTRKKLEDHQHLMNFTVSGEEKDES